MKLLHLIILVALWFEEVIGGIISLAQMPYKAYTCHAGKQIIIFFFNACIFVASILAIVVSITTRPMTMGVFFLLPFMFFIAITSLFGLIYMDRQVNT